MKAIKIFCILVLALTFFGCATQKQLTREESLKLRNEQIETTTKIYNNVSKEQVLIAVDRLFRLCDSDDFKIAHMENAVTGERRWLIYLVLAAAAGQDQWIVAAEEDAVNKKVKVVVRVTQTASTFIPMATTGGSNTWTVATLPGVESTVPGKALYFIFFKRLDYLLGKTDNWLDCDTASKIIEEQKMEGSIECLCNPFNIIDAKPVAEDFGTLMVINHGELYYTSKVSIDEANSFGNYLVQSGFFDGSRKTVKIDKADGIYEFRVVIKKGAESDPAIIESFKSFTGDISKNVFNNGKITTILCDENLQPVRSLIVM